ncbi:MAG TPA: cobalt-precorrin 5A hydrolase [Tissierellia bacterium]|mgnify:CR=1 FL=1|nr:cobalt-precorrin 5A hydrolase [Tissierellia bacterium]
MKLACLSFTDKGRLLGERLLALDSDTYKMEHIPNSQIQGGIKGFLESSWSKYDGFIFISATGIAVRMCQPYIKSKDIDPAIVVIDDEGKFSISLLSGHLGGANGIAKSIGDYLEATTVITTASDNRGIESIDMFAKENDYYIEDLSTVTRIVSMMVNNKRVGIYTEDGNLINYPNLIKVDDLNNIAPSVEGIIIVTSREDIGPIDIPHTILRPKNINIGIGCRKGKEVEIVIGAIELALNNSNLSNKSIRAMGTVEIKKDEAGIIKAAEHYNCPLEIFTIEDILPLEDMFQKSQFVKDTIGVYSVSEPCAYLLGGKPILRKFIHKGVTISINK